MGYSKKASKPTGGVSKVDWDGLNAHLLQQIGTSVEQRIGVVTGIIELGIQPRPDYVEKYKGTKEQKDKLKGGNTYLSEDESEIITEMSPVEQIALYADFPEIDINYGEFYGINSDDEDDNGWKPYRHLITNEFWDKATTTMLAKGASLSCRKDDKSESGYAYDGKSTISKLALGGNYIGSDKKIISQAPVDQKFDLGDLLGAVFTMDLQAVEDGKYVNIKGKNIGSKHRQLPDPEFDTDLCFGISFDGGNDDEALKQVRKNIWETIKRASNWEESGLQADYNDYQARMTAEYKKKKEGESTDEGEEESQETVEKNVPQKAPPKKAPPQKAPVKKVAPKTKPEPEVGDDEDFEDDCPF